MSVILVARFIQEVLGAMTTPHRVIPQFIPIIVDDLIFKTSTASIVHRVLRDFCEVVENIAREIIGAKESGRNR